MTSTYLVAIVWQGKPDWDRTTKLESGDSLSEQFSVEGYQGVRHRVESVGTKVFVCFVWREKLFEHIWMNGILYREKLMRQGIRNLKECCPWEVWGEGDSSWEGTIFDRKIDSSSKSYMTGGTNADDYVGLKVQVYRVYIGWFLFSLQNVRQPW